jgi:hypothetical protein
MMLLHADYLLKMLLVGVEVAYEACGRVACRRICKRLVAPCISARGQRKCTTLLDRTHGRSLHTICAEHLLSFSVSCPRMRARRQKLQLDENDVDAKPQSPTLICASQGSYRPLRRVVPLRP